jgi:hypothetical protein
MTEQPRPDAPTDEHSYLLSVEEAADRYAAAGHPERFALSKSILVAAIWSRRRSKRRTANGTSSCQRPLIATSQSLERSQTNVRE